MTEKNLFHWYLNPLLRATVMSLSIGTSKNNKFSICSKWKIYYFSVSQYLGTLQPYHNVHKYWDTQKASFSNWDKWKSSGVGCPST